MFVCACVCVCVTAYLHRCIFTFYFRFRAQCEYFKKKSEKIHAKGTTRKAQKGGKRLVKASPDGRG